MGRRGMESSQKVVGLAPICAQEIAASHAAEALVAINTLRSQEIKLKVLHHSL